MIALDEIAPILFFFLNVFALPSSSWEARKNFRNCANGRTPQKCIEHISIFDDTNVNVIMKLPGLMTLIFK